MPHSWSWLIAVCRVHNSGLVAQTVCCNWINLACARIQSIFSSTELEEKSIQPTNALKALLSVLQPCRAANAFALSRVKPRPAAATVVQLGRPMITSMMPPMMTDGQKGLAVFISATLWLRPHVYGYF